MSPLTTDELQTISHSFFNELKDAYQGKKNSISFLIHELPLPPQIKDGGKIQVMVFGGTVFKTCVFQKKSDSLVQIGSEIEKKTPLFINEDIFIHFVLQEVQPDIQFLAINFSYPMQPVTSDGLLDGILLRGTKQHMFSGLIGKSVGQTVQKAIFDALHTHISVTVANDTVCLLLSEANEENWNTIVGGIVGTGTNYAITLPGRHVVSLECGNFNKFPVSNAVKQVDEESTNKGQQLIEKEVAGAYLYKHYNYYIQKENINTPLLTSSDQLSDIVATDGHVGQELARRILERSAALAAAQMAGIFAFKTNSTRNHFNTHGNGLSLRANHITAKQSHQIMGLPRRYAPRNDMRLDIEMSSILTFVMEGSLFWQGWHYKENVEHFLTLLGVRDNIRFTKNKHHSIKGTLRLFATGEILHKP